MVPLAARKLVNCMINSSRRCKNCMKKRRSKTECSNQWCKVEDNLPLRSIGANSLNASEYSERRTCECWLPELWCRGHYGRFIAMSPSRDSANWLFLDQVTLEIQTNPTKMEGESNIGTQAKAEKKNEYQLPSELLQWRTSMSNCKETKLCKYLKCQISWSAHTYAEMRERMS